jgi:peroxiredoxin
MLAVLFAGCSLQAPPASAAIEVDAAAPDFTLPDLDGKRHTLSDHRGKTVVLEWFNPGCPFVVAAHEDGPLKDMAASQPDDVVWLAVNSGAPGKQGHGVDANRKAATDWSMKHPILLDESGAVGKQYGATNTPQMVVIDPEGVVQYQGALDNAPLNEAKGDERVAWTADAIAAVREGSDPKPDETKPWGCSVKY